MALSIDVPPLYPRSVVSENGSILSGEHSFAIILALEVALHLVLGVFETWPFLLRP